MEYPSLASVLLSAAAAILLGGAFVPAEVVFRTLFAYAGGLLRLPGAILRVEKFSPKALRAASAVEKRPLSRPAAALCDFLFVTLCGVSLQLYLYAAFDGAFRLYPLLFAAGGYALVKKAVGVPAERFLARIFPALALPLALLLAAILLPLRNILRRLFRILVCPVFARAKYFCASLAHRRLLRKKVKEEKAVAHFLRP